jgi:HEAT repeat protein
MAAHALRTVEAAGTAAALLAALADPDPWVRYFSADAIGRRGDGDAASALAGLAGTDPAPHVRIASLQALTAVNPEMAGVIGVELIHDPDRELATAALRAVAGGGERADDVLEEMVRSADVERARGAVRALAHRPTVRAVETLGWAARMAAPADLPQLAVNGLARLASDPDSAIRVAAVDALIELASAGPARETATAALAAIPEDLIDHVAAALLSARQAVRLAAVETLARMRDARASRSLLSALGDPDGMVRGAAVAAFGRLGTPTAAEPILELTTADPDDGVRRLAAEVCRRHCWGARRR